MRVTHILPKMNDGGGIANVFAEMSAFTKYRFDVEATVVCLETAISAKRMLDARKLGIRMVVGPQLETLKNLVTETDLVVVSYWNHPLLIDFMIWYVNQKIPVPLVTSVKVNGMTLPQVMPSWVFQCAGGVLYTHPRTLAQHSVELLPELRLCIHPFIHLPDIDENPKRELTGDFVAFYAGSLNRFKRLPNLFDLHDGLKVPGCRIEYWGAGEDSATTERLGRLAFGVHKGFSKDIYADFAGNHLLLNPQSPLSYGSYEKIRVECAWMGIPNLVIKNTYIADHVENGVDGLVAVDENDYLDKITWFVKNRKAWQSLSDTTFEHIRMTYRLVDITSAVFDFYRQVYNKGPSPITEAILPMTTLTRALSGMGNWADRIERDPESLSDLELDYALHCEGGLIHHAKFVDTDEALTETIERLRNVLESRRNRNFASNLNNN